MNAAVGARVEVVVARPMMPSVDRAYIAILLAVAVGIHAWLIGHTFVTSRDSLGFARLALNLERPTPAMEGDRSRTIVDSMKAAEHPPGYPAAVLLVSKGVRAVSSRDLPEQMLLSAQIASAVCGVLLAVPMYFLGRLLFGRFAGFAGALLFQALPVPAHATSDGLSEGLFLLLLASSLVFGVRGVRGRSTGMMLLAGLFAGGSYLVRPEGLMALFAIGGVVGVLGLIGAWPRGVAAGRLAALGTGAILAASPYMLLIGGVSNKSTAQEIFSRVIGDGPRAKLGKWDHGRLGNANRIGLFATWYDPERDGDKAGWAVRSVGKEVWQSMHYAPCAFALVGVFALRRRFVAEPETMVLPLLLAVNFAVLFVLGLKIGYVSGRHTLPVVVVGCLFAAAGIERVAVWCARPWVRTGVLLALLASALPAAVKPPHEHRMGHYHAGKYLASVVDPALDTVVDPFSWALFYAGLTLREVPADHEKPRFVYAVLEQSKDGNPHSRLPRLDLAKQIAAPDRAVYHWPEDGPLAEAKVVVYRAATK